MSDEKLTEESPEKGGEDDWSGGELAPLREKIDKIDREVVRLLAERAVAAQAVGEIKKRQGAPFWSPAREAFILRRLGEINPGPLPDKALRAIYREIISACLALEKPPRAAYMGPEGSYSHMAARRRFGASAEFAPVGRILEVFDQVERGACEYGVVPVQNTIEGAVSVTLDSLVERDVLVCGEAYEQISHCLMSLSGEIDQVKRLYTFYQPLGQCRGYVDRKLPQVEIRQSASTSQAARAAADDPEGAAIASALAAELYGLKVIERSIEDHPHNTTRFLIIGREKVDPTGEDKTSLVFSIRDEPGILYRMLQPFADAGINLCKIESRPIRNKPWEYVFFIDLVGHADKPEIAEAIRRLGEYCVFVKNLGSYPAEQF